MFWRKSKHKLPKFPATVIPAFRSVCQHLVPEEAQKLRAFVDKNVETIRAAKDKNLSLDLKLAERIAERCYYLLDHYEEYPPKYRAAVIGAIRYFAVGADAFSDMAFATGLDDDAKIINYVLEMVGAIDQCIEI